MPKAKHSSIRKDADIRVRVNYQFLDKVRALAKRRKTTVSHIVVHSLQKELDEDSNAK